MDRTTLAHINLKAVLRAMEALPDHDKESRSIAERHAETIRFTVGEVGTARLEIGKGQIRFHEGKGRAGIHLWFPSAEAFNAMMEGRGNPIPLKGFTKIAFLKGPFTVLSSRLAHYLRADAAKLGDPAWRKANASLSLKVAGGAVAEIANHDPVGKVNAARMPDGTVYVGIKGGPGLTVESRRGEFRVVGGGAAQARARMIFPDHESAGGMLRGEVDAYTAIGSGGVELSGFVPLLDTMNKILGLVPEYLS